MADYRRLEAVTRDPPGLDLGDDGGEWEDGDAAFAAAVAEVLAWVVWRCAAAGGLLWLLGRAWG